MPFLQGGGKPPTNEFNNFDFGVSATTGYEYNISSSFAVTARFSYAIGLQTITSSSSSMIDYTNSAMSFQIGVVVRKPLREILK